ncbi:hypothetical protein CDAR_81561 [Caerostris darwini]|uniref:Uncharacterized protein n=1 Tax=Caerostris darwini TaxID=1538125 RepID=A0AAV4VWA1_9ARAC|nr:hypothetical protein CDAR_81561 [Caerostris darwini]
MLVDYIYEKDAFLEKASFTFPQSDRISITVGNITGKSTMFYAPVVYLFGDFDRFYNLRQSSPVISVTRGVTIGDDNRCLAMANLARKLKSQHRNSTTDRSMSTNTDNIHSMNCNKTHVNKHALISAVINNDIEMQKPPVIHVKTTVIQQSQVPNDVVILPWIDGRLQVVDHEVKLTGWISFNINVGNIEQKIPKVGRHCHCFN